MSDWTITDTNRAAIAADEFRVAVGKTVGYKISVDVFDEADTRLVRVGAFGDSVLQGYAATNLETGGCFERMVAALQARFGDGGSGYQGVQNSEVADSGPVGGLGLPYITAGVPADWGAAVEGLGMTAFSFISGATLTWPRVRGTTVVVWYTSFVGGSSIEVRADGVLQVPTINTNAALAVRSQSFSFGTAGPRAIELRTTSTAGVVVSGVEGRNTLGVVGYNFAVWGQASGLVNTLSWAGAPAGETVGKNTLGTFPLDVLIYDMGGNDHTVGTAVATYEGNVRIAHFWLKVASPAAQWVGLANAIATDIPLSWHQYVDALRKVTQSVGGAFVDMWGHVRGSIDYGVTKGWYPTQPNVHPLDAGHVVIAGLLETALAG